MYPGPGFENSIKALEENGVLGSFFINSKNIRMNRGSQDAAQILRAFRNGHVMADHSMDHFKAKKDHVVYTNLIKDLE